MKPQKTVILASIVLALFSGCTNEEENSFVDSVKAISSTEEFLQPISGDFYVWQTSPNYPATRTSSTTITIYGSNSQKKGSTTKHLIPTEISETLDIVRGIYISEAVNCFIDIKIEGLGTNTLFCTSYSPLCGMIPGNGVNSCGYTCSSPDSEGNIQFTTQLIHIISDLEEIMICGIHVVHQVFSGFILL